MTAYLVEAYDAPATADWQEQVAQAAAASGPSACRLVRCIAVPDDETWFLLYEAGDPHDVELAVAAAGIAPVRIAAALAMPPAPA